MILVLTPTLRVAAEPLRDDPIVWYEDDRQPIPVPHERDPHLWKDYIEASFLRPFGRLTHPGRLVRRVGMVFGGDPVQPAANINALDEVPNSAWFTNRIGLFPMTAAEAALGPGGNGPDRSRPWTITGAKTDGITFGFRIQDAKGDQYLIKFDPPGYPGMTVRAGVVSNRILHAIGFNVPEDHAITLESCDFEMDGRAELSLPYGEARGLTCVSLDSLLAGCPRLPDGRWCALASKFVPGSPAGPFDYKGHRKDDPNDRIRHEDRRELRGLKVFAAWLNHTDTKQENSLDTYVGVPGQGWLKHYLIDFASTLGAGGRGPFPKEGYEYGVDLPAIAGRTLALGIHHDKWARRERPEGLAEIGYLDNRYFDPAEWKPTLPNTAFANLTDRDGYWAAKIISAFSSEHLEAIVSHAGYEDPRADDYVVRILMERRRILARFYFDRIPPLDFFATEGEVVSFHDLGAERGIYPGTEPSYRFRLAAVTRDRKAAAWTDWQLTNDTRVQWRAGSACAVVDQAPADQFPFLALECQVDRGTGWSKSVTAYFSRANGRTVSVRR